MHYRTLEKPREFAANWITVILFAVIITISLLFQVTVDAVDHFLQRSKMETHRKMLRCAFKELTILGFISLALFATSELGFVRGINDYYLGVSKTEEAAVEEAEAIGEEPRPPTHLTELFETVHVLIFIIMIFFIVQVGLLTVSGYRVMTSATYMDAKTQDDLYQDVASLQPAERSGAEPRSIHYQRVVESLQFWVTKNRFVNAKNPLIPKPGFKGSFHAGSTVAETTRKFPFSRYISNCFGQLLTSVISLPAPTLLLIFFLVVLLRPALSLAGHEIITFMTVCSLTLVLLTYIVGEFLNYTETKLRVKDAALLAYFETLPSNPQAANEMLKCPLDQR